MSPAQSQRQRAFPPRVQSMLDAQAASIHQLKMDLGEPLNIVVTF